MVWIPPLMHGSGVAARVIGAPYEGRQGPEMPLESRGYSRTRAGKYRWACTARAVRARIPQHVHAGEVKYRNPGVVVRESDLFQLKQAGSTPNTVEESRKLLANSSIFWCLPDTSCYKVGEPGSGDTLLQMAAMRRQACVTAWLYKVALLLPILRPIPVCIFFSFFHCPSSFSTHYRNLNTYLNINGFNTIY